MIPGTKIGLRDYKTRLPQTKAPFAEVYFRIDKQGEYTDMFNLLKAKGVQAGLHFWGVLENNILYNLAYPDERIQSQTLKLIKETIDIASVHKLKYVNVHPGNYRQVYIDLNTNRYLKYISPVSQETGNKVLFENTKILHKYALKKNIIYTTETVPQKDNSIWYNEETRLKPIDIGYVDNETVVELAQKGFYIANDFGHTICGLITEDRTILYDYLYKITTQLLLQTKLIHANTTRPPFTGVDTHNGLTDEDFSQNVLPDKNQLIDLLKLFKQKDIWVLNEPLENHEQNYIILKNIIDQIEEN